MVRRQQPRLRSTGALDDLAQPNVLLNLVTTFYPARIQPQNTDPAVRCFPVSIARYWELRVRSGLIGHEEHQIDSPISIHSFPDQGLGKNPSQVYFEPYQKHLICVQKQ